MSDPEEFRAWLAKADSDLLCIRNNLNDDRIPWDTVCFHAQQAAEKLLKAVLMVHGRKVFRTHDLVMLLSQCAEVDREFEELRDDCVLLNPYSVAIRYPGAAPDPSEEEGRKAVAAAERIRARIGIRLGE